MTYEEAVSYAHHQRCAGWILRDPETNQHHFAIDHPLVRWNPRYDVVADVHLKIDVIKRQIA